MTESLLTDTRDDFKVTYTHKWVTHMKSPLKVFW